MDPLYKTENNDFDFQKLYHEKVYMLKPST